MFILIVLFSSQLHAEDGYRLWLRYNKISNPSLLNKYRTLTQNIYVSGNSSMINVIREELSNGLSGLLDKKIVCNNSAITNSSVLFITRSDKDFTRIFPDGIVFGKLNDEGYMITTWHYKGLKKLCVISETETGLLYGAFRLLQLIQTERSLDNIEIRSSPRILLRLLNHWDNLDRTVERGYAGFSLWNWHTLPGYTDKRYKDYARANASIGINGTVLTNVNANATILTRPYLEKVAALANTFRPYGIKVYLTARFSAPIEAGGLKTADPLNDTVQRWWKEKVKEIYSLIPDFGGFLVKANSEGQPGPQNYGRNHADGANMLADAVAPFNGLVMWRAFVYSHEINEDRHKQAFNEFVPLDGKFRSNVMVQVKNGAIDFQPREPFHPLFGAMPKTPLMMEFQLTQEYLGQATNLAYLAPLFKECLETDTYRPAKNNTVAHVIDGRSFNNPITGIAGVANTGNDINWTGHPFAAANWFAFGRLAWDHSLSSESIAEEWLKLTFTNDPLFLNTAKKIMMESREAIVRYMTPLGLHHLMATGHHYGPGPWVDNLSRADWNPIYYHNSDSKGIGFDRTNTGSNALGQYAPEIVNEWRDPAIIPEKYLLWFHHLPWQYKMKSGRSLWEEICFEYNRGVNEVRQMQKDWDKLKGKIDAERSEQVKMLLAIQEKEAVWWRDACLIYFQTYSKLPIPTQYEQPARSLEYYKSLQFPYAPGN